MPGFEKHHAIEVNEEIFRESIKLARRYLKEKYLPDASIDLIDRTMAAVKLNFRSLHADLPGIKESFDKLKNSREEGVDKKEEIIRYSVNLNNKVSQIIIAEAGDLKLELSLEEDKMISEIENWINKLEEISNNDRKVLLVSDMLGLVSEKTGIPIGKVQTEEREKLQKIEESLKKRVLGQDHAIKIISDSILESRSGLSKPGQPIGSFFFLGPTGTGKTELAKTLAEFMFQDESALIRFDMSEFKEEHSAALLYGAPPGYVGYEEGGLLVNKIRQKPYSILLFDEIEKAHTSVFDIFLQILDEGKLHDRLGKEGDFSNAVILFTSNIGSSQINESFEKGIIPKSSELMEIMSTRFRPEFLGRLTEIVPFAPITEENVVKIFEIQLKHLLKLLNSQNIELEITQVAKEFLAMKGFTPKYGARPIAATIRSDVKRPLSKLIIAGKAKSGSLIKIDLKDEEIQIDIIN
ncbi:MAG: ATP-dependent Clp protease ATP-binding subunit [Bacteroidota bacterium]|nr:ATP-dependent Clp protease ATP-binding subunit [Bacteroidota bacterium]